MITMPLVTPQVRRVLERRNSDDRIAVPRSCVLLHHEVLPSVSWLVRERYMLWVERTVTTEHKIDCDIYELTDMGIVLCQGNGIAQR
jgi:hypothetical protein